MSSARSRQDHLLLGAALKHFGSDTLRCRTCSPGVYADLFLTRCAPLGVGRLALIAG
jgi:hypothetical protein